MMKEYLPTLITVSLLVGTTAVSSGNSFLQIQIPPTLNKAGGYGHREALFGIPPYGVSMTQNLYYADSGLCDPIVNKRKGYPTRDKDDSGKMMEWQSPFILMVDRGGCTFVQKVRNAQYAGAAGVVIADNKCVCSDRECINASGPNETCESLEPLMTDDGSGGDISIPAMLMLKHDADAIKKEMIDFNQNVQLQMGWTLPQPDDRVEYEMWTTPSEHVSKVFQRSWKYVAPKFEDHIYFTPRQYVYDGVTAKCLSSRGVNDCGNLCTNNGRYCALDSEGNFNEGISGADVVNESLRRICIWERYGKADGIGAEYWAYINEFLDTCDTPESFASLSCIKDVFKRAKVDSVLIDSCMSDSGGTIGNKDNTLLNLELKAKKDRMVMFLPSIFVNGVALLGSMSTNNVINAICAGFLDGTAPEICDKCSGCVDKEECVKNDGVCSGSSSSGDNSGGISKQNFGFTLLIICSVFGVIAYIHWKKTKEGMRDEVRSILSEYMPLEGGDNENGQSISILQV